MTMAMAVMVDVQVFYRHHAAMSYFTIRILKLDRGVIDVKSAVQRRFDLFQDAIAFRGRNIRDGDMCRKSMRL